MRTLTSSVLRIALACGTSAIALALAPAASAQESARQVYLVRTASEIADGVQVTSTNSDILMGRHRNKSQSLLIYDVQNGAVVIERGGESTAAPLISQHGPEVSFKYDYETGTLQGDPGTASVFNTWLRPIAATSPAIGADATWAVATDLRALGVLKAGAAPMGFKLKRSYQQVDGQSVVLLEYEIPAFHYQSPGGESVVHWARGFAVVDADFSRIFAKGMQHRATATNADGAMRPISVRSSMHGIEADGSSTMGFKNAPVIQAAFARAAEVSGDRVHAVAASGDATADPFPAMLASYLDIAAFAMAEGGANPVPVSSGVGSSPQIASGQLGRSTGSASSTMLETLGLDPGQGGDQASAQALADFILNPPTGVPAGLENATGLQVYQPTRHESDSLSSGAYVFVLGGPSVEVIPVPKQSSGTPPASGSYVLILGGANPEMIPVLDPSDPSPPGTGSVILRLGGSPDPATGSVVFQFSKGGGDQQGPADGANTGSGGGGPAGQATSVSSYTSEAISVAQVSLAPGAVTYSITRGLFKNDNGQLLTPMAEQLTIPGTNFTVTAKPDPQGESLRARTAEAVAASLTGLAPSSASYSIGMMLGSEENTTPITTSDLRNLPKSTGSAEDQREAANVQGLLDAINSITQAIERDAEQSIEIGNLPSRTRSAQDLEDEVNVQGLLDAFNAITQGIQEDGEKSRLKAQLQSGDVKNLVDMPDWMDPGSTDAAEYKQLVDDMNLALADLRKKLDADSKTKPEVVDTDDSFHSDDKFYENNAFDYGRMIGIVPTDLSRWGEWLMTQNIRELERLASLIGYPNLASALADAENLIRQSQDTGYRKWAMQAPSCNGLAGCGPSYLERWWAKQAVVALGDILNDSRGIFSSGGFSDIGISGLNLAYLLRDHALEDGDIVQIRITQFGRVIYQGQVNLTNAGEVFDLMVGRGVASLEIFAVNEGYSSPNTAQITVDNVVRGEDTQTYSLNTGETATLRIEAGAKAGAPGGTP